jgi:hypothetical protein
MKLLVGKPPENQQFQPQREGWIPLKEPKNLWVLQLLAIPIGILLVFLITFIAVVMNHFNTIVIDLRFFLAFALIIPVHELLHAVVFPERLTSKHVMLGFWPKAFVFFAHYDGELTRNRFIVVLVTPFFVLSVLPLILLKLLGFQNHNFVFLCCVINAFCSSGDLLGVFLILFQVPRKANMRNQSFHSYWKMS